MSLNGIDGSSGRQRNESENRNRFADAITCSEDSSSHKQSLQVTRTQFVYMVP
jgi:hypothetical protein